MNKTKDVAEINTDLLVIGGGINGVGIARDAAGRGLRVLLCEKHDLAQHTSSASTKLIHGGLRYLEYYDFKLVRHALKEREILLRAAPHIIRPLRFILPHHQELRPRWLIRLGLFLYDHIGGRKLLPVSKGINLKKHVAGAALKDQYSRGFEYSDCWVEDARLVVLTAMDAERRGAIIKTHTECVALQRQQNHWLATLRHKKNVTDIQVTAAAVINAAGPWVEEVYSLGMSRSNPRGVRFVKGSHLVVKKQFDHAYPYIFQHADGRVLFAIPFEKNYTLLGTTDIEVDEIPDKTSISAEETDYICQAVNEYLKQKVTPKDVVWSYSGVRPLYDDAASTASKVTRDYNLHLDVKAAPIVSVYGGKITTYRKLAEEVLDLLSNAYEIKGKAWTAANPLPGGDIANADMPVFVSMCKKRYPWLEPELLNDYANNYGTRISVLLEDCSEMVDLGVEVSKNFYERELNYLIEHEYAQSAEDVLWRRTKRGLITPAKQVTKLTAWMVARK